MKKIQLLVADTLSAENNIVLPELIGLLPSKFQDRALRYKNKRSSINYCFGRLMLMQAIDDLEFEKEKLNELYYSENDKPLIDGFSFNISHSENFVTIAFSTGCKLGLDIEVNQYVVLKDFKSFFREDEWEIINSAENPLQKFYWFWVRKEAILKAEDGKMNQVKDIFITSPESGYFISPENNWQLKKLEIGENCKGILACNIKNVEVSISEFKLKN